MLCSVFICFQAYVELKVAFHSVLCLAIGKRRSDSLKLLQSPASTTIMYITLPFGTFELIPKAVGLVHALFA